MAFGQHTGPPASARQLQQLRDLLVAAGHDDFRDARGPLGLTQRQASGKFTRGEADALIELLETDAEHRAAAGPGDETTTTPVPPVVRQRSPRQVPDLSKIPSDVLAAELQRRGWVVLEP